MLALPCCRNSPTNGPATGAAAGTLCPRPRTGGRWDELELARARGDAFAIARVVRSNAGNRSNIWWNPQNLPFRQPGEHVAPRGVDGCGVAASDGNLQ